MSPFERMEHAAILLLLGQLDKALPLPERRREAERRVAKLEALINDLKEAA